MSHLIPWPGSVDLSGCAGKWGHFEWMYQGGKKQWKRLLCVQFHGFENMPHCWIYLLASQVLCQVFGEFP